MDICEVPNHRTLKLVETLWVFHIYLVIKSFIMVELKRMARFEVDKGIISQFQLDVSDRFKRRIKTIISKDERELRYQYTDLSGYITLYGEDVEEIIVLWE